MLPLSQAWRLGGLQRASPVPFRASSFTPELPPSGATAQRLLAYLYRRREFSSISSLRLVAHHLLQPRLAQGGKMPLQHRWILDGHSLSLHRQRELRIQPEDFGCLGPRLGGVG
jgi:hypothetical protein